MYEYFIIELKEVRFFAFHGCYELEQKSGTDFIVNLKVWYQPKPDSDFQLKDTVNYVSLFELVKKEMQIPTALLETLISKMEVSIHHLFPEIKEIAISIEKQNPPILNMAGNVAVSFKKIY